MMNLMVMLAMVDAVIQQVEDEVTRVSLRHKFDLLTSDKIRQIYIRCLAHVYAEYAISVQNGLVKPIITMMIRKQDVDSGFKRLPEIRGVSLDEACAMVAQMNEDWGSKLRTESLSPKLFRVLIMLEFNTRIYACELPLPGTQPFYMVDSPISSEDSYQEYLDEGDFDPEDQSTAKSEIHGLVALVVENFLVEVRQAVFNEIDDNWGGHANFPNKEDWNMLLVGVLGRLELPDSWLKDSAVREEINALVLNSVKEFQ